MYRKDTSTFVTLPAPTVEEAADDQLDPTTPEATVIVPPYAGMALQDRVDMFWDGSDPAGSTTDWFPVTSAFLDKPIPFTVDNEFILANDGGTVSVTYTVKRDGNVIHTSAARVLRIGDQPGGELVAPSVDYVEDGMLEPGDVPKPEGTNVRIPPYVSMAARDRVAFTWRAASGTPSFGNYIDLPASWVGEEVVFPVPFAEIEPYIGSDVEVTYTVTPADGELRSSESLNFKVGWLFESPVELDLTVHGYALGPKPPPTSPDFVEFERVAMWGTAPYTYHSDDETVATVDDEGVVTCMGNGECQIIAIDATNARRAYPFKVSGILQIVFLSPSADWAGMKRVCDAAGVQPITLDQVRRFWQRYYPETGPVATYQGWLSYSFWTAEQIGAGTAWAYDLNGPDAQGNATGRHEDDYLQVIGIYLG
ncbi:hypothetical protein PTE30175_05487 [Pandoraea terrae]|uniref:BIG2 domain-containing protein n=1 Tax=Pandoraea terrae TaxID=1537710 RepID=A0A5E4ZEL7_9BURK|nr:hypothetical protein [Pandoraea terrae]VVE59514.1 hypothetical protein PTE30175_05487 [Pandoraea terrae]